MAGNGETREKIGVLALQGDFQEHVKILEKLGVEPVEGRAGGPPLTRVAGVLVVDVVAAGAAEPSHQAACCSTGRGYLAR